MAGLFGYSQFSMNIPGNVWQCWLNVGLLLRMSLTSYTNCSFLGAFHNTSGGFCASPRLGTFPQEQLSCRKQ